MFPGSLTLGEWRLRGNEAGTFFVERFDGDGTLVTDSWLEVARIAFNTNINTAKLETQSLSTSQTSTDTLRAMNAAQLTIDDSVVVTGNLAALSGEFGALTTTSEVLTDTLHARSENQLTVADSLRVTGVLEAQSNVGVTGQVAAQSMFCTGDMTIQGDLYGWKPYFCAGRVVGATPSTSVGRVGYTVWRPSGFPTGVFHVIFNSLAPNNNYVVTLAQQGAGSVTLWNAADRQPSDTGLHVVCYNTAQQLTDFTFHFAVVV
jgi:hypothetical protein